MANFTGGKGCSADTHLIPPTEIKVAGAEDGNSSPANPKIQQPLAPTKALTKGKVGEEKTAALWLLYYALRSLAIRASAVNTEIVWGKATGARDGNSSSANPKIQPSLAPTKAKVREEKTAAMDSTLWLRPFGQLCFALRSLVIRATPVNTEVERGKATGARDGNSSALLSLVIRALPVDKYWLQGFWKLDPILRAVILRVFVAMVSLLILALAIPILLLVLFREQEMSQVWVMSLTLCSYAFLASLFIWRDWWFYTDLVHLSYGPLLAFYAATAIGPRTAIFILHWSTVWAAGYLGRSIALHRLHKGTERGIEELPRPLCHSKHAAKGLARLVYIRAFILSVGWTMYMAMMVYGLKMTQELPIVLILSFIGWPYVALWLYHAANGLMHGVLLKGPMSSLPYLVPCAMLSPAIMFLSLILSVLFHWLLLMALVGFLGYHLAVYTRYLHTAAPCETVARAGD